MLNIVSINDLQRDNYIRTKYYRYIYKPYGPWLSRQAIDSLLLLLKTTNLKTSNVQILSDYLIPSVRSYGSHRISSDESVDKL
jgi:hypothetical protein